MHDPARAPRVSLGARGTGIAVSRNVHRKGSWITRFLRTLPRLHKMRSPGRLWFRPVASGVPRDPGRLFPDSFEASIPATSGGVTRSAALTVTPATAIVSLSMSPTSVRGGSPSTPTIKPSAAAFQGGVMVTLSSSHPSINHNSHRPGCPLTPRLRSPPAISTQALSQCRIWRVRFRQKTRVSPVDRKPCCCRGSQASRRSARSRYAST
jgi:hypothetical protein